MDESGSERFPAAFESLPVLAGARSSLLSGLADITAEGSGRLFRRGSSDAGPALGPVSLFGSDLAVLSETEPWPVETLMCTGCALSCFACSKTPDQDSESFLLVAGASVTPLLQT
jgi:hypothetical protein